MIVKELIKHLEKQDPEAWVIYGNDDGFHTSIEKVGADEALRDLDGWDVLSGWRDLKEMEDYYGSSDSDPLAFTSVCILS